MSLIPIRFLRSDPPYNAGDVAGFELSVARQKVAKKLAAWYGEAPAEIEETSAASSSTDQGSPRPPAAAVPPTPSEEGVPDPTPLPADFPCRKVLVGAGIKTLGAVPREVDELMAIQGIGHGFAQKILAALGS